VPFDTKPNKIILMGTISQYIQPFGGCQSLVGKNHERAIPAYFAGAVSVNGSANYSEKADFVK